MKIDIHTHTKKCKSGDAPTREISPDAFSKTVLCTEVKIIAITNHNVFDLEQYEAIESNLCAEAQVWPGIELDIDENGSRGHLPFLTMCFGPRTEPAGFTRSTWPVTSQTKSIRTAARWSFTVGADFAA